jgi:hypothetical protein
LEELQAIPEGVATVEAVKARKRVVPFDLHVTAFNQVRESPNVVNENAWMRLRGRTELGLYPQVDLEGTGSKPTAASLCELRWLGDLVAPK